MMTQKQRQRFFDKAVEGIAKQGKLGSVEDTTCAYLNEECQRCAIGFNLPLYVLKKDRQYNTEGILNILTINRFKDSAIRKYINEKFNKISMTDLDFLRAIQNCHDDALNVGEFYYNMSSAAAHYNLNINKIPKKLKTCNIHSQNFCHT